MTLLGVPLNANVNRSCTLLTLSSGTTPSVSEEHLLQSERLQPQHTLTSWLNTNL